jgi:hypothetical protein
MLNAAPAIGSDGTIYTVTRSHWNRYYGGIAAVNPDLTPKWWTSLRDRLNDGCNNDTGTFAGASLPANGIPGGCRLGTTPGVDPAQNTLPSARMLDDSSSSIVVTPDGALLYGANARYNYDQGHLLKFNSAGQFLGSYPFGWDETPAIYQHGNTYSIVIKDNKYDVGSYCNDVTLCPSRPNPAYYVTQLDPNLEIEWQFQNTNQWSCTLDQHGGEICYQISPPGFEWCTNAPAIDSNGVVYVNSEDGNIYRIGQGGVLLGHSFLQQALGAAYTPLAIGSDGKIYTENKGTLFVLGN